MPLTWSCCSIGMSYRGHGRNSNNPLTVSSNPVIISSSQQGKTMKVKRNGVMLFWSVGGVGGSFYMTKRAQAVASNILAYVAIMSVILLMGVLYAP
jgi:hypothetical protein